jgi:ABC-2 type transport system permease protein
MRDRRRERPGRARLFRDQVRLHLRLFVRDPVGAFFGIAFPIVFLVVFAGLYGDELLVDGVWLGPETPVTDGVRYIQFAVPAMAVFSIAMIAFVNLATATADERGDGTLKRLHTTPLPLETYIAGRIAAAVVISVGTTVVLVAVGVFVYDFEIVWRNVPAAVVTSAIGTFACASSAIALVAVVRASAVQAASLAILLPLAFLSEIFLFGDRLPDVLSAVGWTFPLRHFSVALAGTAQTGVAHAGFAWDHLAVMAAWGIVGLVVALRWFAWDASGETRRAGH